MTANAPHRPGRLGPLFFLFFLSGVSGLVYESIWSRYIRLFVGSAATAQILVLSLFMGGMGLGALLIGRTVAQLRRPVVVYGVVEGLIGLYALAFPHLQEAATGLCYDVVFPALGGGIGVGLVKWGLAGALILPPCILLGTTFPLMSVGILRRDPDRAGSILGLLYFTNSFGAALGALLSGFVLVGRLGLPGALMFAGALNLLIMVVAMRDRTYVPPIPRSDVAAQGRDQRGAMAWLFLAVAFGTGLSSFMYEIGWIRLLSMILGSATHSFEVMLSAFVLGLALGGLWVRRRMDRYRRPELVLAVVQLLMGMAAIATLPAYLWAVDALGAMLGDKVPRTETLWLQFNVVRYGLCLLVMLPATFCAGMTLPLLTKVMLARGGAEGVVGRVYGVNTIGAICGAIAAGLLLMPVIGIKGVIVVGALVDVVLGLALLRSELLSGHAPAGTVRLLRTGALGSLLMLGFGLAYPLDPMVLSSSVFRRGRTRLFDEYRLLSYVDGRTASVTVIENTALRGHHVIYTNGKPDASVVLERWPADRDPELGPSMAGDEPNQMLVGIVPLMVRPQSTRVALIGFGSGVSAHTILGSPVLERLDTVEIEPEMVRGARFFRPLNDRAYDDPRSHFVYDDAKAYFAASGAKFDLIISEPTNPWVAGVSSLFTVEFYRQTKRYLKPGGLLAQWIQGYELSDELLITVLAAIDREFADYLVVRIGSRDWVIVSSPDGPIGPLDEEPLRWEGMQDSLDVLGIHDPGQIDALVIANRRLLHPYLRDQPPNRDALPLLDTGAERARFMRSSAEFLHDLRWTPAPLMAILGGRPVRPYPRGGIGDLRDPHILSEPETAMLDLRRFADPDCAVPVGITPIDMDFWRQVDGQLDNGIGAWSGWLIATYAAYHTLAPHVAVHETAWWSRVLERVATEQPPSMVADSIELLDALSAADGPRLLVAARASLAAPDHPLPLTLRTVAGMLALELVGAEPRERRDFARKHMRGLGKGRTNEDYAYRVLRAYAER